MAFADVEDLDATRDTLLAAGATGRDARRQAAPGARVCVLADADEIRSACAGSIGETARSPLSPG